MAVISGYSSAQMLAMQKDAIRRVNEMQRQAQERLRQTQGVLQPDPSPAPPADPEPVREPEAVPDPPEPIPRAEEPPGGAPPSSPREEGGASPGAGILQRLGLDEESALLILLLILLVNEGADSRLIMALVYILL